MGNGTGSTLQERLKTGTVIVAEGYVFGSRTGFRLLGKLEGIPTSEHLTGGRHRPPRLYRCHLTPDDWAQGPAA